MKTFVLLLVFISTLAVFYTCIECAPVASPEAKPEPCLEIILRILQILIPTTSRPRRREYTTPEEDEPEPTEPTSDPASTDIQPTSDSSGESADGPSVDGDIPNADSPSTSEASPDDIPNEVIPKEEDTLRKLRKANNKKRKDWSWWFSGIKF